MTFLRGKICHISYLVTDNFKISKDGGGDRGMEEGQMGKREKGKGEKGKGEKGKGEKGNVTEKEKFGENRKSSYTHLRSLKTECTV